MQIRRQMKALLSEIRVQGDILKNLSVTLALGEGVVSGDRQFLKKCQTPHRGAAARRNGKADGRKDRKRGVLCGQ